MHEPKVGVPPEVGRRQSVPMEVVEGDHLVVGDELPRERRPDEAGAAGDQDPLAAQSHAASVPAYSGRTLRRKSLVATAVAALGLLPATATAGIVELHIAYRATDAAPARALTLRCDPARGTVAHPGAACARLHTIGAGAFAPTPRGMLCAQLYGGEMTAVVTGTYDGRPVWVRLTRRDGCAVARWNRVGFLFPPAPEAEPGRPPGG